MDVRIIGTSLMTKALEIWQWDELEDVVDKGARIRAGGCNFGANVIILLRFVNSDLGFGSNCDNFGPACGCGRDGGANVCCGVGIIVGVGGGCNFKGDAGFLVRLGGCRG